MPSDLAPQARRPGPRRLRLALAALAAVLLVAVLLWPEAPAATRQHARVRDWIRNGPSGHPSWRVYGGNRCAGAPMVIPSDGFIGYGWDDRFYPGHHHTGFDIFSPDDSEDTTPVFAAYDGLLSRATDWRSAVIIRHPAFPADFAPLRARPPAGGVIWTYYAHMASADGATSFIAPAFPPGTVDRPVRAGELLGRTGTWSGDPARPVGLHLHFSVVEGVAADEGHPNDGVDAGAAATAGGGFADETVLAHTYDPAPFLGVVRDADGVLVCRTWTAIETPFSPTPGAGLPPSR